MDFGTKSEMEEVQKSGLGSNYAKELYDHDLFGHLYETVDDALIDHEIDELQSFDNFVEIGSRPPNEEGTGRFKMSEKKVIGIVKVLYEDSPPLKEERLAKLVDLMRAFFLGFAVEVLPIELKITYDKNKPAIIDEKQGILFPLKFSDGSASSKFKSEKPLDVFSMFDVMVEYVPQDVFSLLCLTNVKIADPYSPSDEVYGRACGDRVCVVNGSIGESQFYPTCVHEFLHTAGFDHCVAWKCLMNAFTYDQDENCTEPEILQLCPIDLRKLHHELQFDVNERFSQLKQCCERHGWQSQLQCLTFQLFTHETSVMEEVWTVSPRRSNNPKAHECVLSMPSNHSRFPFVVFIQHFYT